MVKVKHKIKITKLDINIYYKLFGNHLIKQEYNSFVKYGTIKIWDGYITMV